MEQNTLRNGHVAVVDTLLTAGVPVDATDHKGLTPLMMACMFGRSMMSAYLLGKVSCSIEKVHLSAIRRARLLI